MMDFWKNTNVTWYDWRHMSNGFFFRFLLEENVCPLQPLKESFCSKV